MGRTAPPSRLGARGVTGRTSGAPPPSQTRRPAAAARTPEDISVSVEDEVLILSGERKFYDEKEAEGFRRVERRFGSFHRAMRLPAKVDPEAVEAHDAHGVLRVTVPKAEDTKPHRIEVKEA
jgi:HSP20 family molecular chaperone IbpA